MYVCVYIYICMYVWMYVILTEVEVDRYAGMNPDGGHVGADMPAAPLGGAHASHHTLDA
jgi:hypothetical protein